MYKFSPGIYEAHLPLSKTWPLLLFDLPTTIASQLDTIPHLASTSAQNPPNGTHSHQIVFFCLECRQKQMPCASPKQLLHLWLKNAISTHHRCPEVCSTPACIGKCACQICCRRPLWCNGGSSFPPESRILSLLSGYYFYSHLCDWHGYVVAMVADLEKNIKQSDGQVGSGQSELMTNILSLFGDLCEPLLEGISFAQRNWPFFQAPLHQNLGEALFATLLLVSTDCSSRRSGTGSLCTSNCF